jgi:hypothetical protein
MNWSPDDPRRFAVRLDAEAIAERGRAIVALYNSDEEAADEAYRRAAALLKAAGWASRRPDLGLALCQENGIHDVT